MEDGGPPPERTKAPVSRSREMLDGIFVARDPRMKEIVKLLRRLAKAPSNVLVSGESGTGKDLVAHALHFWSPRAPLPIVNLDLPSIPGTLIESELFGYERGAFTGATASKAGKLEMARGGTVILDHIGELPPFLQAKLLRVVEDRRFERLGGTDPIQLDARIVATSGADLERAVDQERFRRDLFHRLGVFWIRLPPLRERQQDIVPLAKFFLERDARKLGRTPRGFSPDVLEILEGYEWPGNVRELKGVVEHGSLLSRGDRVERGDLPPHLVENGPLSWMGGRRKRPSLDVVEKLYIERVLTEVGGNQTRAAEILGISRKSLWERRRRYELK